MEYNPESFLNHRRVTRPVPHVYSIIICVLSTFICVMEYTPTIGDVFPSFDDACFKLCSSFHQFRGSLRVKRRDFNILHVVFVRPSCPFEASVSYSKQSGTDVMAYHLKRSMATHTCSGGEHEKLGSMHDLRFIKQAVGRDQPF